MQRSCCLFKRLEECKYLGLFINKGGCEKCKGDKIFEAQQWLGRFAGVAKFRANKYEVIRGLWKDEAVPSIMYAMEVINWTADTAKKLEKIQNGVGRIALGANRYIGVVAIRVDMGWNTFEE